MLLRVHTLSAALTVLAGQFTTAHEPIRSARESVQSGEWNVRSSQHAVDASTGRLGFSLECTSCPSVTGPDGGTYLKIEQEPIVAAVRAGSPAASAGLTAGDVIAEVDGAPIRSDRAMMRLLAIQAGSHLTKVELTVRRGDLRRALSLTVGATSTGEAIRKQQ
ncbi:PDZ domain-containing protein [Luteitalea sp.]|uniref:PDZ domain-containing protein n=1 Tax=Luteitalea sp. TaxID=2004800 RepID=UPI0034584C7D